jgi:two-component system sensor histidine kinase KdpD
MLQEGHRLKNDGIDVAIGLLETHGRAETARLAEGLEIVPRRRQEYRGIAVEEMDVDAILTRKPQVVLIDELAHTNVPGSRNAKRYEDVQDILASGIHVVTTMNVQHLESLYDIVEKAVGVKVRERLPDAVLAEADQIVDVDLTAEDLRRRLEEGRIYPQDRIDTALANFFTFSNLQKLRELTLRELASQIDLKRREAAEEGTVLAPDQIVVCLSSRGPNSEKLLRYASRLAGRLNQNWYAIYVQTPPEEATVIDGETQRIISETLTLAKQLGAMVFTYKGEDVAGTILRFAREYRVGHIVIGKPAPKPFWQRFGQNRNIVRNLIRDASGITVVVVETGEGEPAMLKQETIPHRVLPNNVPPGEVATMSLGSLLSARRIIIWDRPVRKEQVLRALVETVAGEDGAGPPETLFSAIAKREEQGSTFFNEGAAFPHVRVAGLPAPLVALGLTKAGVPDAEAENAIAMVFLILTPAEAPDAQTSILRLAGRAGQSRHLVQNLRSASTAEEAMDAVVSWETV